MRIVPLRIYPIDIRIPLSVVSQIGTGSFVLELYREIFYRNFILYRDALFIRDSSRRIVILNIVIMRLAKFQLDKFDTVAQTFSASVRCSDRVAIPNGSPVTVRFGIL